MFLFSYKEPVNKSSITAEHDDVLAFLVSTVVDRCRNHIAVVSLKKNHEFLDVIVFTSLKSNMKKLYK